MTERKITKLLADILDLYEEDIEPNLELTPQQGVEKIHLAKLVIECEKKFKTTIHDEDVAGLCTIKDFAKYIENSLAENDGNAAESSEEERFWWYYQ